MDLDVIRNNPSILIQHHDIGIYLQGLELALSTSQPSPSSGHEWLAQPSPAMPGMSADVNVTVSTATATDNMQLPCPNRQLSGGYGALDALQEHVKSTGSSAHHVGFPVHAHQQVTPFLCHHSHCRALSAT